MYIVELYHLTDMAEIKNRKRAYPSFSEFDDNFEDDFVLPYSENCFRDGLGKQATQPSCSTDKDASVVKLKIKKKYLTSLKSSDSNVPDKKAPSISFETMTNSKHSDTSSSKMNSISQVKNKPSRKRVLNQSFSEEIDPPKLMKQAGLQFIDKHVRKRLAKKVMRDSNMQIDTSHLKEVYFNSTSKTFSYYDVINDGNSMYSSISYLLFGVEKYCRLIQDITIKTMKENKHIFDKECSIGTNRQYSCIDSYIKETNADKCGRMPNLFLELQALAYYFKLPIYLFTVPIDNIPTRFFPRESEQPETGCFVLYGVNKYIRPVILFDGDNFQHKNVNYNFNKIRVQNTNKQGKKKIMLPFAVEAIRSLSDSLFKEAIVSDPLILELSVSGLTMLDKFAKSYIEEVNLNSELFLLAITWKIYSLIELMLSRFRDCKDVRLMATFLDEVFLKSSGYLAELVTRFEEACLNAVDLELKQIQCANEKINSIVSNILTSRLNYVVATNDVTAYLSETEFMFTDIFPHTALCFNWKDKTMKYFTGIKPNKQRWISLPVNRRLFEEVKIVDPRHMVLDGVSLYAYVGMRNGSQQICHMEDIFNHTSHLNFSTISKFDTNMTSLQMVKSDRNNKLGDNNIFLVDMNANKAYDIKRDNWLDLMVTETTKDYHQCVITEQSYDTKHRFALIKSEVKTNKLFGTSIKQNNPILFKYSVKENESEVIVKRRLAEDKLYFDNERWWEESNILATHFDLSAHYIIPQPENFRDKHCVMSLVDTRVLNEVINRLQFSSTDSKKLIQFILDDEARQPLICKYVGIDLPSDVPITREVLEAWYIAVRKLGKSPDVPQKLINKAYETFFLEEPLKLLSLPFQRDQEVESELNKIVSMVQKILSSKFSEED